MLSHSVFLVLRHNSSVKRPMRDVGPFSSIGKLVRCLESFSNVERSLSKGDRNRELESAQVSQMEE